MTAIVDQGQWVVTYESQGCYDDGGIGHDAFWTKRRHTLEGPFNTDEKAVKAAKAWIRKQSGTYLCRGSFCSNKGLYRLVEVEFVVPERRRSVRGDSGRSERTPTSCRRPTPPTAPTPSSPRPVPGSPCRRSGSAPATP